MVAVAAVVDVASRKTLSRGPLVDDAVGTLFVLLRTRHARARVFPHRRSRSLIISILRSIIYESRLLSGWCTRTRQSTRRPPVSLTVTPGGGEIVVPVTPACGERFFRVEGYREEETERQGGAARCSKQRRSLLIK